MQIRIIRAALAALLALAAAAGSAAAQDEMQTVGAFSTMRRADPISDEDRSGARVVSADSAAMMWWQCFGDTVSAFAAFREPPTGDEVHAVYRFDQDRPDTTVLIPSPSNDVVWLYFPEKETYALTSRAMSAGRFVLRVWDADGGTRDFRFSLDGGARALRTLPCVARMRPPAPGQPAKQPGKSR
jgi:hypothetical protein